MLVDSLNEYKSNVKLNESAEQNLLFQVKDNPKLIVQNINFVLYDMAQSASQKLETLASNCNAPSKWD